MNAELTLSTTNWQSDEADIRLVRKAVFIRELGIPPEMEWDDADKDAIHVLVRNEEGSPIATGRLLENGHIGRMAVLEKWRGSGAGRTVLNALIDSAQTRGDTRVWMHAQQSVAGFYEKQGFTTIGEVFMAAGIPHVRMERAL